VSSSRLCHADPDCAGLSGTGADNVVVPFDRCCSASGAHGSFCAPAPPAGSFYHCP
jgi:hypothetical protein